MTLGEKISQARKKKGMTLDELGRIVGLGKSSLSGYENGTQKNGPDAHTLIRISEALDDDSILLAYLEDNPVYKAIIPRVFPDLNNIRRDPAIIFTRLAKEADEAREAALILAEVFSNADYRRVANFEELFKSKMEQVIDIKRAVEVLEFQLLASGVLTKDGLRDIYARQQKKCEEHGHHVPDRRSGDGRRQ